MKVKCPACPGEIDLGPNCDDLSDTAYQLSCPALHEHLLEKGSAVDIECENMRIVRNAAILKFR